jgi:hypothetical protein
MTVKYLINHVLKNHKGAFLTECNYHWLVKAEKDRPLECVWERKDDFGDTIYLTLYACLGTNKTFTTEKRAITYLKKDKEAMAQHKKEITKLMKAYQENKSRIDAFRYKWEMAKARNDPTLVKAIWRKTLNCLFVAKMLVDVLKEKIEKGSVDPKSEHRCALYGTHLHKLTFQSIVELYEKSQEQIIDDMEHCVYDYKKALTLLSNVERVIEIRDYIHEWLPINFAYYKSNENPNGLLLKGDDEWGMASDEMPELPTF